MVAPTNSVQPASREVRLACAIQAARTNCATHQADALCWELALTVRRGVAAEIRSLSAWRRSTMEWTELENVGLMGAFKAARKFDPTRARFTTYASLWIRAELRRATGEQAGQIRLPENAQRILQKIRAEQRAGAVDLAVIAEALGEDLADVLALLAVVVPALRLDVPPEDIAATLQLVDPQPTAEATQLAAESAAALSAAITTVLADPATDPCVRWHLLMNPAGVRDPVALAALKTALEARR